MLLQQGVSAHRLERTPAHVYRNFHRTALNVRLLWPFGFSVGSIRKIGSSRLQIMPKRPIAPVEARAVASVDLDLETVMHRLYHLTICKSRIPKVLREYKLVERRQEEEEQHLCEIVGSS